MSRDASRWQLGTSSVLERDTTILQAALWTDCAFVVSSPATGTKTFRCHKLFLAKSSPTFAAMFYGEDVHVEDEVHVEGVDPATFQQVLDYIYVDKLVLTSLAQASSLCDAALRFELPHVSRTCADYLRCHVDAEHACSTLELARRLTLPQLEHRCVEILQDHTAEILQSPEFENIAQETLVTISTQDELDIASEVVLIEAAASWAKYQVKRENKQMNLAAVRLALGPVLSQLRFLSLDMEEFADLKHAEYLLTTREIEMIKLNIKNSHELPPDGICCNRKSRSCASPFIGMENLLQEITDNNEYSCVRSVVDEKFTFVQSVTPFEIVINVSKSVELTGLQIPSQVSNTNNGTYPEDIRVDIRDDSLEGRNVLLSFDYRENEPYNSWTTIKFPLGVHLVAGRDHVVRVTTYNEGMYPTGDCSCVVHTDDKVTFTFEKGFYNPHITGFIRTLFFKNIN